MFNARIPSRFERTPEWRFVVPHCRYEVWAAALGAAAAVGGAAYEISGAGQPAQPNLAASSAALSNAEASALPIERQLAGAAETGGTVLNPGYTSSGDAASLRTSLQQQIAQLQGKKAGGWGNDQNQQQIQSLQNQLAALPASGPVYKNAKGQIVPASHAETNFGQFGGAQTQAAIEEQNAANQLQIAQQYDPALIQSALAEEALADPNSVAARAQESKLIQQQINEPITNPVAAPLESQISARVSAGKGLDQFDETALNNATQQALADRGGSSVPADFTSPLTTGEAGNQRQLTGIQSAQNFLGSGTTPEDVQYRQQQQDLANLSAEVSGQTPTSEFSSLSNASRGPNQVTNGAPLPLLPSDITQTAGNAALTTQQQQEGQANNWLAGISTVLNGAGAVSQFTGARAG